MKKIIVLLVALVAVVGTMSVGTWAYFNDVTTVASNTITAGTLTLTVGGGTPSAISLSDKKPTDGGTATSWTVVAGGTVNGSLNVEFSAITNNENTRSALETASGDTTNGATEGELGSKLKMAVWLDANADGNIDDGEKYLNASTGAVGTWAGGDNTTVNHANASSIYYTVDSFGSDAFTNLKTDFTGSAGTLKFEYYFPHSATKTNGKFYDDNQAQSDGVEFTVYIELVQYVAP